MNILGESSTVVRTFDLDIHVGGRMPMVGENLELNVNGNVIPIEVIEVDLALRTVKARERLLDN